MVICVHQGITIIEIRSKTDVKDLFVLSNLKQTVNGLNTHITRYAYIHTYIYINILKILNANLLIISGIKPIREVCMRIQNLPFAFNDSKRLVFTIYE